MIRRFLRSIARSISALGLADLGYRVLGAVRRLRHPRVVMDNARIRAQGAPDGLPVPPDGLIHLVGGFNSLRRFLDTGGMAADSIRTILGGEGRVMDDFDDVLDFGCGCGRVLRWWHDVAGPRFHGCDYNRRLVRWVEEHLPGVDVRVNKADPPLPYEDSSFDFVYALSVLTHLTEETQQAWLADLRRVLRPDALLLVTLHGEAFVDQLTDREREQFAEGKLVVTNPEIEGTNLCAAYHPPSYVRNRLADGFEVIAAQPRGARGNGGQDQYLLRPTP